MLHLWKRIIGCGGYLHPHIAPTLRSHHRAQCVRFGRQQKTAHQRTRIIRQQETEWRRGRAAKSLGVRRPLSTFGRRRSDQPLLPDHRAQRDVADRQDSGACLHVATFAGCSRPRSRGLGRLRKRVTRTALRGPTRASAPLPAATGIHRGARRIRSFRDVVRTALSWAQRLGRGIGEKPTDFGRPPQEGTCFPTRGCARTLCRQLGDQPRAC